MPFQSGVRSMQTSHRTTLMLRAKVVVVGDACVGKTAVVQMFKSGGHDYPKNYIMVREEEMYFPRLYHSLYTAAVSCEHRRDYCCCLHVICRTRADFYFRNPPCGRSCRAGFHKHGMYHQVYHPSRRDVTCETVSHPCCRCVTTGFVGSQTPATVDG